MIKIRQGVRALDSRENKGFACNTPGCPCCAEYGLKSIFSATGVMDVRCYDCAAGLGWVLQR